MTKAELQEAISQDISSCFKGNLETFGSIMLAGIRDDMSKDEIISKMILNSIELSAQLSAQYVITNLAELGIIDIPLEKPSEKSHLKLVWDSSKNPPQDT